MKKIFVLVLSIWAISMIFKIEAVVVMLEGTYVWKTITVLEENREDPSVHEYHFMRDVTKDNDFLIIYYVIPKDSYNSILNGTVRFCQADVSTLDGTVAALVARSLGLDINDGTPCPVKKDKKTSQGLEFNMEVTTLDRFFSNDTLYIEFLMTVPKEDWGIIVHIFPENKRSEYFAVKNETGY